MNANKNLAGAPTPPPSPESGKVVKKNARKHLEISEVERLRKAASKKSRWGHRDATLIMVMFSHGLRSQEAVDLTWSQVIFDGKATMVMNRVKKGSSANHPIEGPELRALRILKRDQNPPSEWVFTSERGTPMTTSNIRKLLAKIGKDAGFEFRIHPHMLRHGCGYYMAGRGDDTRKIQDYLGHQQIQHTVIYTKGSEGRFRGTFRGAFVK